MKEHTRKRRAWKIVSYLKRTYPKPKSELRYQTPFQFLVAVILSAQCTDRVVNRVTAEVFRKYKTANDFARARPRELECALSSVPFFRNKTKAIIASAKSVRDRYGGRVPDTETNLTSLHGIGYKTAHVILGGLYGVWEGIATDTHVKRFARKFDLTQHTDLKKISKDLERLIPKKDWKYANNGFVLYGRYVCSARPHECGQHPLTKLWPPAAKKWPKT